MGRKLKIGIGSLVVIVLLSILTVGVVSAQDDTTTSSSAPDRLIGRGHGMAGRTRLSAAGLEAAAEMLGMTTDELSAELWGGRTLAELAENAGVDLVALRQAVNDADEQAHRDAIEEAVADGSLSREQADWILEGLDKGYFRSARGFLRGPGQIRGRVVDREE